MLPPRFEFSDLPEESVLKALQKVNPWKATGRSNYLLTECAAQLARPLQFLFNLSLKSGIFPRQWEVAKIQPLYKQKGDRANPANYRPIALLSAVSKVFESLMKKQLLDLCLNEAIIIDNHFGFLPGRSEQLQLNP